MTILLLPFQFGFLWLGLTKLCWIKVARVNIHVLFLMLEEMLSTFHHWEWYELWVYNLWPLLCCSMFPVWWLSWVFFLIVYGYWMLSKAFYATIVMIIWLLFFKLLIWCITPIDIKNLATSPSSPNLINWIHRFCADF